MLPAVEPIQLAIAQLRESFFAQSLDEICCCNAAGWITRAIWYLTGAAGSLAPPSERAQLSAAVLWLLVRLP